MWIEKTRNELSAAEKKFWLRRNLAALLCWAGLAYFAATASLWHGLNLGFITLPVKRVIPGAALPLLIVIALVGTLYWLYRTRQANKPKTVVCPLCNRIKSNDEIAQCDCGGVFRSILEMKWVDGLVEKPEPPARTNSRSGPPAIAAAS